MFKQAKGFTLIELMVTLVVLAVVLGIAIPSFNTQIMNNRSVSLGEDFATAVNFVRSEAVKRRARVSMCASSDGATCTGNWTDGYIAFVDNATSDNAAAPVVSTILRIWGSQDSQAVIDIKRGSTATNFIRYTGTGTLARVSNDPVTIDVAFQNCTGNSARTVAIGLSGLVSVTPTNCSN